MAVSYKLNDFKNYKYNAETIPTPAYQSLISQSDFKDDSNVMAFIGLGGTISSVYSVAEENIRPTKFFPVCDLLRDLHESFGIADQNYCSISLLDKDSRNITVEDIEFAINFIKIKNKRIIVLCGTYGLPIITQIVSHCAVGEKIIGVTGSMLISSMKEHDADSNGIGIISAVNALHKLSTVKDTPIVFAGFHGRIFKPEECKFLDLHPDSHADNEFYRGQPIKRNK